jgi:hypothetical protein
MASTVNAPDVVPDVVVDGESGGAIIVELRALVDCGTDIALVLRVELVIPFPGPEVDDRSVDTVELEEHNGAS